MWEQAPQASAEAHIEDAPWREECEATRTLTSVDA